MTLLIISFIAGLLTVLAPCVLPLLPIIIGGSVDGGGNYKRTIVIISSLSVSLVVFTLLLKASTLFIDVPPAFWTYLSSGIILFFGLSFLFPSLWDKIPGLSKISSSSNKLMSSGFQKKNFLGDVIIGAALGPVFSTCSPTYFLILATVLPVDFTMGLVYILVYVFGLALSLFAISILGDKLVAKLGGVSDPRGNFKRSIGFLFVLVAIFIATGYDKVIQQKVLDTGFLDVTKIESSLLNANKENMPNDITQNSGYPKYIEIADNAQYINMDHPPTIAEYVGKKVIIVDFMTYSCINCKRTFPYLNDWYSKYEKDGLVIIGIHTPEFAFEKNIDNVRNAMAKDGIKFPIVLDNDYKTWNAWSNNSWPHKFIIDIDGSVVYEHAGEGKYAETEAKIVELLNQKKERENQTRLEIKNSLKESYVYNPNQSEETYFGSDRGIPGSFVLGGNWDAHGEYQELKSATGKVEFNFNSQNVYLVASQNKNANSSSLVDVYVDGKLVKKGIQVNSSNIYQVIENSDMQDHKLELSVTGAGFQIFTLTFGQ